MLAAADHIDCDVVSEKHHLPVASEEGPGVENTVKQMLVNQSSALLLVVCLALCNAWRHLASKTTTDVVRTLKVARMGVVAKPELLSEEVVGAAAAQASHQGVDDLAIQNEEELAAQAAASVIGGLAAAPVALQPLMAVPVADTGGGVAPQSLEGLDQPSTVAPIAAAAYEKREASAAATLMSATAAHEMKAAAPAAAAQMAAPAAYEMMAALDAAYEMAVTAAYETKMAAPAAAAQKAATAAHRLRAAAAAYKMETAAATAAYEMMAAPAAAALMAAPAAHEMMAATAAYEMVAAPAAAALMAAPAAYEMAATAACERGTAAPAAAALMAALAAAPETTAATAATQTAALMMPADPATTPWTRTMFEPSWPKYDDINVHVFAEEIKCFLNDFCSNLSEVKKAKLLKQNSLTPQARVDVEHLLSVESILAFLERKCFLDHFAESQPLNFSEKSEPVSADSMCMYSYSIGKPTFSYSGEVECHEEQPGRGLGTAARKCAEGAPVHVFRCMVPRCNMSVHHVLRRCDAFAELSFQDKVRLVKKGRWCSVCLSHKVGKRCYAARKVPHCGVHDCTGMHHAMLHPSTNHENVSVLGACGAENSKVAGPGTGVLRQDSAVAGVVVTKDTVLSSAAPQGDSPAVDRSGAGQKQDRTWWRSLLTGQRTAASREDSLMNDSFVLGAEWTSEVVVPDDSRNVRDFWKNVVAVFWLMYVIFAGTCVSRIARNSL